MKTGFSGERVNGQTDLELELTLSQLKSTFVSLMQFSIKLTKMAFSGKRVNYTNMYVFLFVAVIVSLAN